MTPSLPFFHSGPTLRHRWEESTKQPILVLVGTRVAQNLSFSALLGEAHTPAGETDRESGQQRDPEIEKPSQSGRENKTKTSSETEGLQSMFSLWGEGGVTVGTRRGGTLIENWESFHPQTQRLKGKWAPWLFLFLFVCLANTNRNRGGENVQQQRALVTFQGCHFTACSLMSTIHLCEPRNPQADTRKADTEHSRPLVAPDWQRPRGRVAAQGLSSLVQRCTRGGLRSSLQSRKRSSPQTSMAVRLLL